MTFTRRLLPWLLLAAALHHIDRLHAEMWRARHDARRANSDLNALLEDRVDSLLGSVFGE